MAKIPKKDDDCTGSNKKKKTTVSATKKNKCKKYRPKRDINCFIYYTMLVREHMKKKNPGVALKQTAVIKQATVCWAKVTVDQKKKYAQEAKKWSQTKQKKSRCPTCGRP